MDQALALEIILDNKPVFLTGAAGSGKTYILNQAIRELKQLGKHVSVTATTGLAATHVGGSTIHAWSGIGVHDELPNNYLDHFSKTRRETIEKTDVLVIDEISMLHDYRLDMVDRVCQEVRGNDEPFGGMQVILCGDFFQLPPINRSDDKKSGGFVVNSDAWKTMQPVVCYLNEQYRQDDDQLLDILTALRQGDIRRRHAEQLLKRVGGPSEDGVTELHTVNVDVDRINQRRLESIDQPEVSYQMITTGSQNYVDNLKRACLAAENLVLKKGALVMAIKNSLDRKYVNGSVGEVVDFESLTNYPVVKLRNGHKVTFKPDSWELRDGDKKRAGLNQIPLRLAYAMTIHKSQGMTLDAAVIDLRKAFVEGMGYVALSRVRSLEGLSLLGINKMALKVSQTALEIDQTLRKQSADDHAKYEHLRENLKKRQQKAAKVTADKQAKKTSWNERLEEMRKTHPNAYRPWSTEQDNILKQSFLQGVATKDLSKELGRHERSIVLRLQKHFGEDAVSL